MNSTKGENARSENREQKTLHSFHFYSTFSFLLWQNIRTRKPVKNEHVFKNLRVDLCFPL